MLGEILEWNAKRYPQKIAIALPDRIENEIPLESGFSFLWVNYQKPR